MEILTNFNLMWQGLISIQLYVLIPSMTLWLNILVDLILLDKIVGAHGHYICMVLKMMTENISCLLLK